MALTKYTYSITNDFPGGAVNTTNLKNEIQASVIVTSLNRIDTAGAVIDIWFNAALSAGDETILDGDTTNPAGGLIAAHDNRITVDLTNQSFAELAATSTTTATSEVISGYIGTAATSTVTIRATTYTPQGTNAQRSVSSTSVNDTSAGTGARTVKVTYLNATGNGPFTETITLNGTTAVNTVATNIALIEKMEVVTVGSVGGNEGTIRIHTTTAGGGSVWASIATSDNRTYWAHHYVPVGKTMFFSTAIAGASVVSGSITVNVLNPVNTNIVQFNPGGTLRYNTATNHMHFYVPIKITGPAIVFLNSRPDTTTASTTFAAFGYVEY